MNLGSRIYSLTSSARTALFQQGEFAELTYGAFDLAATSLQQRQNDEKITLAFPVGLLAGRQVISGAREYTKDELLQQYRVLAYHQLAINTTVRLVTIIEALLGDLIRAIVLKYPKKLGAKKQVSMQVVLEASTIEDIHLRATDSLLNELVYKSPGEFAAAAQDILSLNLLECPAFHRYVEVKATRDIYLHNGGYANEVYTRKAGAHARVGVGHVLPIDLQYFLESYESCLQLLEWIESNLQEVWPSAEFEAQKNALLPLTYVSEQVQPNHDKDHGKAAPTATERTLS